MDYFYHENDSAQISYKELDDLINEVVNINSLCQLIRMTKNFEMCDLLLQFSNNAMQICRQVQTGVIIIE